MFLSLHFAGGEQSFSAFEGFSGNVILVSSSLNSESLVTHSRIFLGTWEDMAEVTNHLTGDGLGYVVETGKGRRESNPECCFSVLKAFPISFLSNFPTTAELLKGLKMLCFHMWKAALRVNYWLPHIRGEL